jgi:hypothetical protein
VCQVTFNVVPVTTYACETAIVLNIAAGAFTYAGANNWAATQLSIAPACEVIPVITTSPPWHDGLNGVAITVTFSHTVSASDTSLIPTCVGCTFSAKTRVNTYTYTWLATPLSMGAMVIDVAANEIVGAVGGISNTAASTLTIHSKIPRPVLTAVLNGGRHGGAGNPLTLKVSFIMPVYDFAVGVDPAAQGDITVTGATITAVVATGGLFTDREWTITLDPINEGNILVYVPAGVCSNAADHSIMNTASPDMHFYYTTQWGVLQLSTVRAVTALGNTAAPMVISGYAPNADVMATLAAYKFGGNVEVCFERIMDSQFTESALVGTLVAKVYSDVERVTVVATLSWSAEELDGVTKCFTHSVSAWVTAATAVATAATTKVGGVCVRGVWV